MELRSPTTLKAAPQRAAPPGSTRGATHIRAGSTPAPCSAKHGNPAGPSFAAPVQPPCRYEQSTTVRSETIRKTRTSTTLGQIPAQSRSLPPQQIRRARRSTRQIHPPSRPARRGKRAPEATAKNAQAPSDVSSIAPDPLASPGTVLKAALRPRSAQMSPATTASTTSERRNASRSRFRARPCAG